MPQMLMINVNIAFIVAMKLFYFINVKVVMCHHLLIIAMKFFFFKTILAFEVRRRPCHHSGLEFHPSLMGFTQDSKFECVHFLTTFALCLALMS